MTDTARLTTHADHRHAARAKELLHGRRGGSARPRLDGRLGLRCRLQVKADLDHTVGEATVRFEARLGEDGDHAPVLRQHARREGAEPDLAGPDREVLEQQCGDPPAVMLVIDEEGDLGLGPVLPAVVASDADELVVAERDQRHAVDVVDIGQMLDISCAQLRARAEVPEVDALRRLPAVEGDQPGAVVGPDGPDRDR